MRTRITWKFLGALIFLVVLSVAILYFFVSRRLSEQFEVKLTESLRHNAVLVGQAIKPTLVERCWEDLRLAVDQLSQELDQRITIISIDGTVWADSEADPTTMPNHLNRIEIRDALTQGFGQSYRVSDTVKQRMKYVAICLQNQGVDLAVVRLALPQSVFFLEMNKIVQAVLTGALAALVVALVLGYLVSSGITAPILGLRQAAQRIAKGDLDVRVKTHTHDELGQLAESLNAMAKELQERMDNQRRMDRARTDFVANVSHELKTPLTLIKGYIETLQDKAINDPERARRFMAIINEHADRLGRIVDDLISIGELEFSKDSLHRNPTDLKKLIDDVVLGFGYAVTKKRHQLQVTSTGEDFVAPVDAHKIEQVLVNLVDNAVKYTPERGQIDIHLAEDGAQLCVTVRDNGIGIPPEDAAHVFERFYRVDKARSRELGGTGLGLGIAKHIVLAHQGSIDLSSQPGKGTVFTVKLPK